jgi:hypothetical protein
MSTAQRVEIQLAQINPEDRLLGLELSKIYTDQLAVCGLAAVPEEDVSEEPFSEKGG